MNMEPQSVNLCYFPFVFMFGIVIFTNRFQILSPQEVLCYLL